MKKIIDSLVDFFTIKRNGKRRLRTFLTIGQIYALIAIVAVVCVYQIFMASGYDMYMDCSKAKNTCVITKTSILEPVSVKISEFPVAKILEVKVEKRKLESGKEIYDIYLDNGPYADDYFIDYAFENVIKANTVKMKMDKFLSSIESELSIKKRCYFNDYFCF